MGTMIIQYDPTNALVQSVLNLIQQVKNIQILSRTEEYVPNAETLAAMKEAREGKTNSYNNVQEMMNEILKDTH